MSFARAKVQRFNEKTNCTPSPADYDVKSKKHISGAVIAKTDRFIELRSPSLSDNSSFISNGSVPVFRTPTIPKKGKVLHPPQNSGEGKTKPVDLFKNADELEALKEKIVECNNKDVFIQDLTDQLEELKLQLSNLQKEIVEVSDDKLKLEGDVQKLNGEHEVTINKSQEEYQQSLEGLREKINIITKIMDQVKMDYRVLQEENKKDLKELLKNLNVLEEFNDRLISTYKILIDEKTDQITIKEKQTIELHEQISQLTESHQELIDDLKLKHQMEVTKIENETSAAISNLKRKLKHEQENSLKSLDDIQELKDRELKNLELQLKNEKETIRQDLEAKIKQLTENYEEAKVLAEMQMKEKCNDIEMNWKFKLEESKREGDEILKECQAIAEYNIIQTEIEKNKAVYELNENSKEMEDLKNQNVELKTSCNDLNEKCRQLEMELSNVVVELNEVRRNFSAMGENYKAAIEKLTKDKHTYEITITKTHKTIETLKKRLMSSDKDVEQLKAELEATEESKLEMEGKCNQLMDELQILCGVCDDMKEQKEMAETITADRICQIEAGLLTKLDEFKQTALHDVNAAAAELKNTKNDLTDTMELLHKQQKINDEAGVVISNAHKEIKLLEESCYEQTTKNNGLEGICIKLTQDLRGWHNKELLLSQANESLRYENNKLQSMLQVMQQTNDDLLIQLNKLKDKPKDNTKENYDDMCKNYQELNEKYNSVVKQLKETEEHNKKLQVKVDEQESLIGPFREHLEAYEMEYKVLFSQKVDAEKEAKEMGLKYAEILGHQNQKQKIKHLKDLKKKNYELLDEKKELENKVRAQNRIIEKLRKDLSNATMKPTKTIRQQKEDKENFGSPNRTLNLNASRHDSPSAPLKERN